MSKKDIQEYEIGPPGKFALNTEELWRYRELFLFFTWRDIKVKYKQTLLGFSWAILQPLLLMFIFIFFFSKKFGLSTEGLPPAIFYFTGLLFWNLFSQGLTGAGNSMIQNSNIIKKIYFPRLIIPLSAVLTSLFDFGIAFLLFLAIAGYYILGGLDFQIFHFLLCFSLGLILTLLSTFGLGTLLASLNVKYRDFRYIIPFLLQILFFLSPIVYSFKSIEESWMQNLLALNPLTPAIVLFRNSFFPGSIDWTIIAIGFLSAFLLFIFGILNFRRTEAYFADFA